MQTHADEQNSVASPCVFRMGSLPKKYGTREASPSSEEVKSLFLSLKK